MAPRRRTGNSEPPGCAEEIRVADAGQGIVDRQAGMHSSSLVDDLQQVVEVGSGLDQQSLLAPAARPGRGDEFLRVHRLGGDDRGVGERIGDLVVGLAVVVEVVADAVRQQVHDPKILICLDLRLQQRAGQVDLVEKIIPDVVAASAKQGLRSVVAERQLSDREMLRRRQHVVGVLGVQIDIFRLAVQRVAVDGPGSVRIRAAARSRCRRPDIAARALPDPSARASAPSRPRSHPPGPRPRRADRSTCKRPSVLPCCGR